MTEHHSLHVSSGVLHPWV